MNSIVLVLIVLGTGVLIYHTIISTIITNIHVLKLKNNLTNQDRLGMVALKNYGYVGKTKFGT